MIRFEDYEREIKIGLLLIADAISVLRDESVAAAFIGFESKEYSSADPTRVDLKVFRAAWPLLLMYDFACARTHVDPSGDYEIEHLRGFLRLVPTVDLYGSETSWTGSACRDVLDLYVARQRLDDTPKNRNSTFSVRELALLSDMSEGAVRNALSAEKISIKRPGEAEGVPWGIALPWLQKRRGFRRSETAPDAVFPSVLDEARSIDELFAILARLDEHKRIPRKLLKNKWRGNLSEIVELAAALDIDPRRLAHTCTSLWLDEAGQRATK